MTKLNYKTRLALIDKRLDFIDTFKKLVPGLKKCGSNYKAKSPFQEEKTPSFIVSPKKHVWHCFSTGVGGKDIVSFVAKSHNLKFTEALDWVETRFGLNKHNRTEKTMMTVLQVLNENGAQKHTPKSHDKIKSVYEDMQLKLIKNFKKKADDRWHVLDPIIEYIWDEFDHSDFRSLNEFKSFLRWAYLILEYFRKTTISSLHSYIMEAQVTR